MSMQGKVVVVTGSNVGIGLETAVGVAALQATTVLACRNQAKAEAAAKEVNNAGGTWSRRRLTAQGFEYTFGVNHLGHFYLTNLLLARLESDAPARVVSVTSIGHHFARGGMRFDDLQSERSYEGMDAYCRSKLANVLFVRELARREAAAGVTANAAHPGWVRSSFAMDGDTEGIVGLGMRVMRPLQISPRRGARTSIYLATSPEVAEKTGMYWVRSKPGRMSQHARDDAAAERLWSESEQLLVSAGFGLS